MKADRQTDRETDGQTNGQTDGQTDGQIHGQTDKQTDIQDDRIKYSCGILDKCARFGTWYVNLSGHRLPRASSSFFHFPEYIFLECICSCIFLIYWETKEKV